MLRVHFLEDFSKPVRMLLRHSEYDRLAGQLARLIFEAGLHDLLPLLAERISVAHFDFDFRAGVIEAIRVDALLGRGVAVFFAEVHSLDAFALETGVRLVETEIDEELLLNRLW